MNIKLCKQKISEAKAASKKRNFPQSLDLIMALKDIDMKNSAHHVDTYVLLHNLRGKPIKVAAFVGGELKSKAEGVFSTIIPENEFEAFLKEPKKLKSIIREHGFFVAQANLMPKIAQHFGKFLGPKGKMPNPKAGCVIDTKTDLKALYEKLQRTIRVTAKVQPQIQCSVGTEDMDDDKIADNAYTVYDAVVHALVNGTHNISRVFVKLTMGPPVEVK
jgi:large subunit ribosomal protein L1